jgi:hypothetical protein
VTGLADAGEGEREREDKEEPELTGGSAPAATQARAGGRTRWLTRGSHMPASTAGLPAGSGELASWLGR